jgi:hypothetical protein
VSVKVTGHLSRDVVIQRPTEQAGEAVSGLRDIMVNIDEA